MTRQRQSDRPAITPAMVAMDDMAREGTITSEQADAYWREQLGSPPSVESWVTNAYDLMRQDCERPAPVLDGYLYPGLALLAGRPKGGKSFLALNLGLAVACPWGRVLGTEPEHGSVLYLALEDPPWRLQGRLEAMLGTDAGPRNLSFATRWPRINEGGLEMLREWLGIYPETKLVVIDTLGKVRPLMRANGFMYQEDYEALGTLKTIADDHGIVVLVVHHTRKAPAEHAVDSVSGTAAIAGAADTVLVLSRARKSATAVLDVTGRDVAERQEQLAFDDRRNTWSLERSGTDDASECAEVRVAVIQLIGRLGTAGIGEVAAGLDMNYEAARKQLVRLTSAGFLDKVGRGIFALANVSGNGHI